MYRRITIIIMKINTYVYEVVFTINYVIINMNVIVIDHLTSNQKKLNMLLHIIMILNNKSLLIMNIISCVDMIVL